MYQWGNETDNIWVVKASQKGSCSLFSRHSEALQTSNVTFLIGFVPLKHSCARQAERPSLVLSSILVLCVICTNALQNRRVGQIKGLSSSASFLRKFPEVHPQGAEKAHDNHSPKYSFSLQQFAAWRLPEPEVLSMVLVIL